MKLLGFSTVLTAALLAGCGHSAPTQLNAKAFGTQIVEIGGSKQIAQVGATLPQPIVVQVNGADGNPITGALVHFRGDGMQFTPAEALTDSSGQVSVGVQLGFNPGDYQMIADTPGPNGGAASLSIREIALGYEQALGKAINDQYCIRCHDRESSPERVSNFDNLSPSPHEFTDGATLNRLSDSELINIISYGGEAVGKSPQNPAYGATLKPAEIRAVVAYIRAIADPPYQTPGVKYGK